ncbi:efflux RND transporter periplasmic adaptor subunit [Ferrimonas balearica]|uniref:efflux RND transporter periplasmic adaptor subunit n=1 Tax=Ferrimonas balearica TaxID=44012 RepID=UPI001C995FDB|nr:efflux RND transporter periplasmic adaptor subunit [Ferrimonas balearica]MBY5991859.1 efflux RND transporter periplasmic adaptor subunit [Ferrimonas balearica]
MIDRPPRQLLTLFGLAGLLLLPLSGCSEVQSFPVQEGEKPVKILDVPHHHQDQELAFSGQIEASDRARLAFRVPGQIQALTVRMGSRVEAGQLLASLDPTDYQLAVEARQAEYDLAKVRLARDTRLFQDRLISEDQLDRSQTQLTVAEAQLAQAKTDLGYTQLTAPFSGAISLTHKRAFEITGANEPVMNLQGDDVLDISFNLPSRHRALLGQPESAHFTASFVEWPGLRLDARFKESQARPDRDTNSYRVTLSITRPSQLNLLPGMATKVHLSRPSQDAQPWYLPEEAVVSREGQLVTAWKLDSDDRLTPITLTLDDQGAVIGGVEPGDRLVAAGAKKLQSGQKVRRWVREGGL